MAKQEAEEQRPDDEIDQKRVLAATRKVIAQLENLTRAEQQRVLAACDDLFFFDDPVTASKQPQAEEE